MAPFPNYESPSRIRAPVEDWDVVQPIKLRGLDDGSGDAAQFNRTCDVTLTRVGSTTGDPVYDARLARVTRLALARAATPPGRRLIVARGEGPSATSEAGAEVSLVARLSAPPPNGTVVAFGVSVDDPSEAVVVAPADLRFTREVIEPSSYGVAQKDLSSLHHSASSPATCTPHARTGT
jgi:hypothetical protein